MKGSHIWKTLACRFFSLFQPERNGPLICVGMVRNEMDILDTWLAHLDSIFDRIILFDHLSNDGSREKLLEVAKNNKKFDVRLFDEEAALQSQLMSAIAKEVSEKYDDGWLFFLDADEFVAFKNRHELVKKLNDYRFSPSVLLKWYNVYPVDLGARIEKDSALTGWRESDKVTPKSILNLRYAGHFLDILQGNHRIRFKKRFRISNLYIGGIIHIPIRSHEQLSRKLEIGLRAIALLEKGDEYCEHWRHMRSVSDSSVELPALVYSYGHKISFAPLPAPDISGSLKDYVSF